MARAGRAKTKITTEGVREDIATGQPYVPGSGRINPSVTAGDLAAPPTIPVIPPPKVPQTPSEFNDKFENTEKRASENFVRINSEESKKRDDVLTRLQQVGDDAPNSQSVFEKSFDDQIRGMTGERSDKFMERFADENERLALLRGKFRSAGERISSGGQGQSKVFEAAQLGELSREEAVQVGNQALLVEALQGNYSTAKEIALETANFAFQDRQFELQNLSTQFEALQGIVDSQEQQVIQRELADLEDLRANVNAAINSGAATVEEMQQLTSLDLPDDQKKALAQQIASRGAASDRQLSQAAQRAQTYAANLSARKSLLELAEAGDPDAVTQLGYDPNNLPLTHEEITTNENLYAGVLEDLARVDGMLGSDEAVRGVTGVIRNESALSLGGLGALFDPSGGKKLTEDPLGALAEKIPVAGNLLQGINAANQRDELLSNASYIIKNLTFENFAELKERGVNLTPISNAELSQIAQASSVIASMARYDKEGNLTHFVGSENKLRDELTKVRNSYSKVQDELNAQMGLNESELREIDEQ